MSDLKTMHCYHKINHHLECYYLAMGGVVFFIVAATFFCAYEFTRSFLGERLHKRHAPLVDMMAASVGEVVCM